MKKNMLIYAVTLLVVITAISAFAQGRKGNSAVNKPTTCPANCQKMLDLSSDQIVEMTRIRTAFTNDTASLRTELQTKMREIAALWAVNDPDLQLIKQKSADADAIRAEIRDKAIDARGAILKVLTPAQRAKCIQCCQNGNCACGLCGGLGMGLGPGSCGMGAGNAAGTCPMGTNAGKGRGGAGMGMGGQGMCGNCPMRQ